MNVNYFRQSDGPANMRGSRGEFVARELDAIVAGGKLASWPGERTKGNNDDNVPS